MNYVELSYDALNAHYNGVNEAMRYKIIKAMNNGDSIEDLDEILTEWVLTQHKQTLLNSLVERKQNERQAEAQEQVTPTAPPQIPNAEN